MDDHTHSDTPRVYHNGGDPGWHADSAAPPQANGAAGAHGGANAARPRALVVPDRFAVYADSEATEDLSDEELPTSDAFDPANVLMWGLAYPDEVVACRRGASSPGREHFVFSSTDRLCMLLELAGYGPLRVLYL